MAGRGPNRSHSMPSSGGGGEGGLAVGRSNDTFNACQNFLLALVVEQFNMLFMYA